MPRWTDEDIEQLTHLYNDYEITIFDIARKMGRTTNSITKKASNLGLVKNVYQRQLDPSECKGHFKEKCIDKCPAWYECLDIWVDKITSGRVAIE